MIGLIIESGRMRIVKRRQRKLCPKQLEEFTSGSIAD